LPSYLRTCAVSSWATSCSPPYQPMRTGPLVVLLLLTGLVIPPVALVLLLKRTNPGDARLSCASLLALGLVYALAYGLSVTQQLASMP
jgi:hypothetical protein